MAKTGLREHDGPAPWILPEDIPPVMALERTNGFVLPHCRPGKGHTVAGLERALWRVGVTSRRHLYEAISSKRVLCLPSKTA